MSIGAPRPRYDEGPDLHHVGPPRISFSRAEVLHLGGAVVVLSYAFALILTERGNLPKDLEFPGSLIPDPMAILSALLAVASGFVLHELAHKIVAQRYGHWAEFRAQFGALGLSVGLAGFFGVLIAAPGAVLIQGRVTPRENGIISLVGPGTNFLVALVFLPFFAFEVNQESTADHLFMTVTFVNSLLAVFNLIPLGPFDGRKVWRWSRVAYIVSLALCLALFVFALQQGSFP